jgi:hypothetical protein
VAELIIDTPDKHDEVVSLLREAGVGATYDVIVDNVFRVPDSTIAKVEEILAANLIEFQWSGEGLDEEDYVDDVNDYDEE